MKCFAAVLFVCLLACSSFILSEPGNKKQPPRLVPGKVLIINSFDAGTLEARKNKKELFRDLTDSLMQYLSAAIQKRTGDEPVIISQRISGQGNTDSLVLDMIRSQAAGKAVLIRSLEAFFEEAGEREYTNDDGKQKIAISYDLCTRIGYTLYNTDSVVIRPDIYHCKPFTERSVGAKFSIRFGPDIVGKKKYTYGAVKNNAGRFVTDYFRF
jgi:hypothetical protein